MVVTYLCFKKMVLFLPSGNKDLQRLFSISQSGVIVTLLEPKKRDRIYMSLKYSHTLLTFLPERTMAVASQPCHLCIKPTASGKYGWKNAGAEL